MENASRAWTFIAVDPAVRQYGGNLGHSEDYKTHYTYDGDVANHLQVKKGDLVFIRDRQNVLGMASITNITSSKATKTRQRCPTCNRTDIKQRTTNLELPWRCSKGHEFKVPKIETATTTRYTATYGDRFCVLTGQLSVADLKQQAKRPNDQISIEEIDPASLLPKLVLGPSMAVDLMDDFVGSSAPVATDADEAGAGPDPYVPGGKDRRTKASREVLVRRGQKGFRDKLRKRYSDKCVVCGCSLLDLLEAAHISPYRGDVDNHLGNGLLLRADLHTLFDLFLFSIEPKGHRVRLHPRVLETAEYSVYEGKRLFQGGKAPDLAPLEKHWAIFKRRLLAVKEPKPKASA